METYSRGGLFVEISFRGGGLFERGLIREGAYSRGGLFVKTSFRGGGLFERGLICQNQF